MIAPKPIDGAMPNADDAVAIEAALRSEQCIRLTIARLKLVLAMNRSAIAIYRVELAQQRVDDVRRGGDLA
jgi:hypothetical protein